MTGVLEWLQTWSQIPSWVVLAINSQSLKIPNAQIYEARIL